MIKNLSILLATLLTAGIANAKISPVYEVLRIIDEATEAMAEFKDVEQDELKVSNLTLITEMVDDEVSIVHIASAEMVEITANEMVCKVKINRKNPPPGLIGASLLSANVIKSSCIKLPSSPMATMPSMTYEKIAPKLTKAASEGKLISGLEVTSTKAGKAKLKLVYAK